MIMQSYPRYYQQFLHSILTLTTQTLSIHSESWVFTQYLGLNKRILFKYWVNTQDLSEYSGSEW